MHATIYSLIIMKREDETESTTPAHNVGGSEKTLLRGQSGTAACIQVLRKGHLLAWKCGAAFHNLQPPWTMQTSESCKDGKTRSLHKYTVITRLHCA
mmetsp:Transcript_18215/g.35736  ORF Transcript_18215/g.35736 Transcript_18215/m.35736 type:complete len:97 (+) Transcript_18215:583-873(+)